MTASTTTFEPVTRARAARPSRAFRALLRKDATEWLRGRRAWVVLALVSIFMILTSANSWIVSRIIDSLPPDVQAPAAPASMAPLDNLFAGLGTQIFVFAAIFAVASLLVRERESGTLAWVASKPVSRRSIWLSKWISASIILVIVAVIVPTALDAVAVTVLYGVPDLAPVLAIVLGAAAAVTFYAALGLAVSTFLPGQVPVVATGFLVFALVPMLAGLVSAVMPFLPTSILDWSVGLAMGTDVGWVTPVAWVAWTAGLVVLGTSRIQRIEL
jgi:ABC-2 type transport system permease protein